MASRLVTYPEWLANGHYPDGSNPGAKFNPDDKNLRSYYDNYVTTWNGAAEALRVAINVQHGLGSFNSGGGDGGGGGSARHAPSTVTSEVFSPAYERPGLLDWSRYMPTDSRNILGGGYMDPSLLASQRSITADGGRYYQPWAQGGVAGTGASGLWDYAPPPTSLFSPFGRALSILALESGSSGSPSTSSTTNGEPNKDPGWDEPYGSADPKGLGMHDVRGPTNMGGLGLAGMAAAEAQEADEASDDFA